MDPNDKVEIVTAVLAIGVTILVVGVAAVGPAILAMVMMNKGYAPLAAIFAVLQLAIWGIARRLL